MRLTKRQIAFLRVARHRDPRREKYHAMWCLKAHRAVVATDGFFLHAVHVPEPSETFAFRTIQGPNGEKQFALTPVKDELKIEGAKPKNLRASMSIDANLLRRTLEALGTRRQECIRLSIYEPKKNVHVLALSGELDNLGGFYALIMGMYKDRNVPDEWNPWPDSQVDDQSGAQGTIASVSVPRNV